MKKLFAGLLALALLLPGGPARADGDGRRVLDLAAVLLDETVERAVSAFNEENPDWRVQVTDYYDKSTNDLDGALAALDAALAAGEVDLIDLGGALADMGDALMADGTLADLTDYVDADPLIRREDYLSAVWDAASMDGRVYAAAPAFSVVTLACRAGDVPAGGMTWERFTQMAAEGQPMFLCWEGGDPAQDRARLLEELLRARFGEFADEQAGTCSFDSQAFVDLLEFVKTVPLSADTARLAEMAVLFGYTDAAYAPEYLGGGYVFCGWPGTDGAAGRLQLRGAAGMCADTDCPEGCWAFLRSLLLADVRNGGLPARLDRRQAAAEQAVADAGVSQAQIDAVNALYGWDYERQSRSREDILDLAYQAAREYYAGQTGAEAAAADLQSRASLYLSEQS